MRLWALILFSFPCMAFIYDLEDFLTLVIKMIFSSRDVSGQVAFEEEMPKVNKNNRFFSENVIANLTWLKLPRYLIKIIFCPFSKVVLGQLSLCVKSILKPWKLLVYSFNFLRTTI